MHRAKLILAAAACSGSSGFPLHASTTRARTVLRRFATHTPDDTSHLGECGAARYTLRERNPYDVHVYYSDAASKAEALALRERMQAAFPWMRFHSPKDRPIGPHPCPMWECDFADFEHRGKWSEVSRWVAAHHGDLSVLIHPHSTDGAYADHTENAFWAGDPLPLRIGSPQPRAPEQPRADSGSISH